MDIVHGTGMRNAAWLWPGVSNMAIGRSSCQNARLDREKGSFSVAKKRRYNLDLKHLKLHETVYMACI